MTPPLGDIAHIGHAQLFTPDLDASVAFFTDYLGLTVNGEQGDSVHLWTFDDCEHHSLVLTARETPGLGRLALRTSSEEALHRRIAAIEEAGGTGRWAEDEPGLGKLYVTTDPDGHEHALYWESEHYRAPEELRPALKNQPQAKPNRAVGVRRLDHVNFLAADVLANAEFQERVLGARPTEQIMLPVPISMPSSRRSSSTSTNPAATASSCATRSRGWC
ncbi:catechol 2,3-dioxygenase-like lactoylglutathione lyase family enzyme [Streptomyces sp. SAI-170]